MRRVIERAGAATLQKPPLAGDDARDGHPYAHKYLTRLEDAGLFPGSPASTKMTVDEVVEIINELLFVDWSACCYRIAIFDHLAKEGLLPEPGELGGEELKKFIFMKPEEESQWRDRLAKRNQPPSKDIVAGRSEANVTETKSDQPRPRGRMRKSYISPSREGTVTVSAHVEPELKDALKKKFEQSGFDNFNEFLSAGLQSIVEKEPTRELKPSAELAATALEQSRNLEKTISLLTQDLSRATLQSPSRSR